MNIDYCPKCGSDSVDTSSWNAEYESHVKYSCQNCSWKYESASGIGVSSKGQHPRKFEQYCRTCENTFPNKSEVDSHNCTPEEVVRNNDGIQVEEICEILDEWHYSPEKLVKNAIRDKKIELSPTFFKASIWEEEKDQSPYKNKKENPEITDAIISEFKTAERKKLSLKEVQKRLAAESNIEELFIQIALQHLAEKGVVKRQPTMNYKLSDDYDESFIPF